MFALLMAMSDGSSGEKADVIEDCISKIGNGDKEALAELYRETHAAVYGFALSLLKNKQDAEDVLQDVYIQVWKNAGGYQAKGKPLAWLFTITRNLSLMTLRQRGRTVSVAPEDWQAAFADEPEVNHEDRLMLGALMEILSDEEREIVVLHAMTGLKHREIAALLELGLPTVLSKYSRAVKKLRSAWKEADR